MPKNFPLARIPAAIAILALAAVALLWLAARTPYARRAAADWIAEATGLPATVASLRIGFLPAPALAIDGLAIAQPSGFGEAALVEAGRLRVTVPWRSLFGAPAVRSVTAADLVLRPAIAADGADNWSGVFTRLAELGGEGESAWSIGRLEVERGAIEYRDAAARSAWRLTAITIEADDLAPGAEFPLEVRLAGVAGEQTFHFALNGSAMTDPDAGRHEIRKLQFRVWAGGEPLPLAGVELQGGIGRAAYEATSGSAAIEAGTFNLGGIPGTFSGTLELGAPQPSAAFAVTVESFAPRAPAITFGYPLPVTADPRAFGALQLSLDGELRDGELRLPSIAGQLDDTQFSGSAVPARRQFRLIVDRIDADRYLPPEQKSAGDKKATLESIVAQLGALDLDAEIRIGELRVAGARARDTVIRVERDGVPAP